jgi:hypothetical protein
MVTLRKTILALTALALPAAASSQQTSLQPASASDIAAAVSSCWGAVSVSGVDPAKLQAAGWSAASAVDKDGKSVALPMGVYGKTGANAVIITNPGESGESLCTVVARVTPSQVNTTISTVKQALVAVDPSVKAARDEGGIVFLALPRLAMLNATGSKERPGMRIVVGYQNPEKK